MRFLNTKKLMRFLNTKKHTCDFERIKFVKEKEPHECQICLPQSFFFFLHLILSCMSREKYHATSNSLTTFVKHHKQPLLGKHHKRPLSTRFFYILKQDNNFGTIQEWLDREIWQKLVVCGVSPKVVVCGVSQKWSFVVFPQGK